MSPKKTFDENELRQRLTEEQFDITQRAGTERAFTGTYHDTKDDGVYRCIVCGAPLFHSETKYDSGSGWPSFYQPISPDAVATKSDRSLFMKRTEVLCGTCEAHLGHVFTDGPEPTGERYCMNSAALHLQRSEND